MKKSLSVLFFLLASCVVAQNESVFTHYSFNGLVYNPAYAGIHGKSTASLIYRNQWTGFDGAPSTQIVSFHTPFSYRPISLGGFITRDVLGLSSQYSATFSGAYRIPLSRVAYTKRTRSNYKGLLLSFGYSLTLANYSINLSEALTRGGIGVGENIADIKTLTWNTGAGLMLHNDRFYVGISSPRVIENKLEIQQSGGKSYATTRHFYLTSGYAVDIAHGIILKPNFLVRLSGQNIQFDVNANILFHQFIWLGASLRYGDSVDAILGIQVYPNLLISYATDFSLTKIGSQSHEIMLSYQFDLDNNRAVTPRFF